MASDASSAGPRFAAHYSDGQSAGTKDVEVMFTERGLAIRSREQIEPLIWPYAALRTAEPLGPHAIDALVTYSYQRGVTLFVADPTFARRLAVEAPHLTTRAVRWRAARPWLIAAALAGLITAAIMASGLSPARTLASAIPDGIRDTMGKQVVTSMTSNYATCQSTAGTAALQKLMARLSQAAETKKPFNVTVVDWNLLNAFAAPGERIILTRELIERADSPDELAGVIAHEMGHGLELHPETSIVRGIGLAAAAEMLFGGGGGAIANIGIMLTQLSYSRAAEREADGHALRILKSAAISPAGLADFFNRIKRTQPKRGDVDQSKNKRISLDVLSTHPHTSDRLKRIRLQPPYPATPAVDEAGWSALKKICANTTSPSP